MFALARAGDTHARDALVESYLPLARSLARRYESSGEAIEDLIQVANLGLVHAVDRFDPSHGAKFTSFAVPTILGEIKRHFRDRTWTLRVPRALNELTLRVDRAVAQLTRELGRSPSPAEIAESLSISDEEVLEALQAGRARHVGSLDARLAGQDDELALGDTIACPRAARDREAADARLLAEPLLDRLGLRERQILELRFAAGLTQSEIGAIVGVSQMQVSRLIRRALQFLHDAARDVPESPITSA